MNVIYSNSELVSATERETSKLAFELRLGPFLKEFNEKEGIVTINFAMAKDDNRYFQFVLGNNYDLGEFIERYNKYVTGVQ